MTSPAYLDAVHDLGLSGLPLGIYLRLYHGTPELQFRDALSPTKWRPVKRAALAMALRVNEDSVRRAMNKLVALGYLERQNQQWGPRMYRIAHDRMDVVAP